MNNNLKTIFVVVLILVITSVVSLDIGIEDNAIITSTSSYKIENDDGGYTYVNTLGYSYYQDGNLWKKINTSITPQSIIISGNEYTLGVTEGFYNAYFREKSSKVYGRPVALVKDDYIITYSPGDYLKFDDGTQVSGKKLTTAEVSENGICYNGQYGAGIDLCYEYSIDTVKELLIIDSFSLLPIPENNSNLELKHITRIYNNNNNDDGLNITYGSSRIKVNDLDEINTNEEVYIMGNYNNTIFYLPEIYAWETKHNEIVNSSDYTEEEIIEMGFDPQFVENNTLYEIPVQSRIKLNRTIKNNRFGNLDIRIKTPYSWLENLTYPVYIDDTTTYNVDGSPNKAYWIAIYWDGNILSGEPIDARGLYPPRPLNYYDLSKDFISEYDSTMYDYIASDDGDKNEWLGDQSPGSDTYVNLLYNFSIAETVGNITSIEVLWNGYTSISATPAFYFGIWNYTSADWSVINITNDKSAADVDWGTTLTSGFSD